MLRGQVLEELKRPADAVTVYRKALERDRTSQDVLLSLVRLCLASGDELAALDYLRRFTLQVDRDVNGLLLAAETYLVMKRHDEAAELARRARDIGFHEKAQRILGLVALARNDYPAAVRHLQRADPDDVVLTGWIEAQLRAGQLGDLERTIDRARRVTMPSARLRQVVEKGQAALARKKKLRAGVRVEPGKEEAVTRAAEAVACAELAMAEHLPADVVATLLQPALAFDALRGPALAVRARLALERGHLTAALADAERAIALGADGATAYLVRGRVRLERAQPAAVADLERAATLTGRKDAEVLAFLADALHLAGRTAEAVRTLKEATTLRPKDGALAEKLRALEAVGSTKRAG
ncbi:MAG: tetratricopeptide repeat protein [Gemmataceae bacterium]